jgi:protein-S-isoprenylcysteine O-methyltransferase Ste14
MPQALLINIALLLLFSLQHTLISRKSFKRKWTNIIPESVVRSVYVLFSSMALNVFSVLAVV